MTGRADRNFSIASLIPAVYLPTIVFEAALGAILPVVAVTSRELGGSLGQAGLVVALLGVGHILGDVPAGTLAHRIGDRRAMLVAGGVMVLALLACALAPSLWLFALAVLVTGFVGAVFTVARQAYVTEAAPPLMRARALSTLAGTQRIGTFIGPFAGALAIPVYYAGERLTLTAGIDGPPDGVEVSELAGLPLTGALTSAEGVTLLAYQGTAGELLLAGALPTALVAAPLPDVLRPDGELRVDATLDLLSGPRYDAAVTLTAADASFSGTVTGTGADLSADISGAGLELSFAGDTLRVSADDASLAPLLPPGALPEAGGAATTGVLDGTLVYDAGGWRGALTADLSLPLGEPVGGVVASVALLGRGASLELSATGTGPAATRFDAGGTVTPTVDLSARLDALDGMLTADLGFTGDDGLRGTVTSSPVTVDQYASLPAQSAALSWRPGESLRLVGDGIDVTAGLDEPGQPLTGTLALPFTLLDGPGSLTADLGGSLAAPSADLQVLGPGLRAVGSGTLSAASATLTLHEPALGRLLPDVATQYAGLIAEPVTARADWTADDGWTLTANGVVAGAEPTEPGAGAAPSASLDLDLAGVGARFSGGLGVSLDGRPVAMASIAVT